MISKIESGIDVGNGGGKGVDSCIVCFDASDGGGESGIFSVGADGLNVVFGGVEIGSGRIMRSGMSRSKSNE